MECTIGGTRRHLAQLALGLPRDRFAVTVVASAERDPTFRRDLEEVRRAGREAIELPMVRAIDPLRDRAHGRELRRIVREGRFDVVHTHSSKAGVLGRLASLRERVGKRVHTPHTFAFAFAGGFSRGKRALFYGIERMLGRRTDRLVCVSPSEAEQARRLKIVPADRIRVVENGIDPRPFAEAPPRDRARAELGWEPGRTVALVVALWNPAKGQLEAVDALARIPAERRPLLALAGGVSDPAYGASVEAAIARHGLARDVLRLGHRDDVPRLLAACDVALCPSRWEGMPYAVLEAMAAGRPVLATATNGSRDAVVDDATGRLVPVGDAEALARALAELARDGALRERLGAAGRTRARERYGVDRMVEATAALYEEVAR